MGETEEADGTFVEGHAVEKQPTVQRLSVFLLYVGIEGSGERAAAAEESDWQGEENTARTAWQVRCKPAWLCAMSVEILSHPSHGRLGDSAEGNFTSCGPVAFS